VIPTPPSNTANEYATGKRFVPTLKTGGSADETVHRQIILRCRGVREELLEAAKCLVSGVIYFLTKQRVEKRLAGRFRTAAMGFYRDEYCVDFLQLLWIIEPHDPTPI
jgi:hypothetical protein